MNHDNRGAVASDMNAYSPKEYWTGVAQQFGPADEAGLAPVLHPQAPRWFNQCMDELQERAIRRALAMAALPSGARVLDVGCGTGRWVRRYREAGLAATGIDATPDMLRWARQMESAAVLAAGEAHRLPFAHASFDCVSDVTVIQHIPAAQQLQALAEMARVVKPGGRMILMELIRGKGGHIFPRTPRDWIHQAESQGMKLIGWFGQEFLLLDRAFVRAARVAAKANGLPQDRAIPAPSTPRFDASTSRRIYWSLRHFTVPLSAWAEPVVEKLCPARLATHGVFVFKK